MTIKENKYIGCVVYFYKNNVITQHASVGSNLYLLCYVYLKF